MISFPKEEVKPNSQLKKDHRFSKMIDNVMFKMASVSHSDYQELVIELFYCQSHEHYELVLTDIIVKEDEQLRKCFQTVEEIYQEIGENFEEVTIMTNGVIQFQVKIGKKKRVPIRLTPSLVEAQAKQQSMAIVRDLILKMEKMGHQASKKVEALELTVANQVVQLDQLRKDVNKLREMVVSQKEENNTFMEQMKSMQKQRDRAEEERQILKLEKDLFKERKTQQIKTEPQAEGSSTESEQYIQLDDPYTKTNTAKGKQQIEPVEQIHIYKFWPHPKHKNNNNFQNLVKGDILRRKSTHSNWQNYILNSWLKSGSIYIITIEIIKTFMNNILLGVGSKQLLGKFNTRSSEEIVTCDFHDVSVWVLGHSVGKSQEEGLGEGTFVRMKVDLYKNRVEWLKLEKEQKQYSLIGTVSLPKNLQQVFLYPVISMRHMGDAVKIHE